MGPFDNHSEEHIFLLEYMYGPWFEDPKSGDLYIIPTDECSDDVYGPDHTETYTWLSQFYRENQVSSVNPWEIADYTGLEYIPESLRRFNPEDGYFHS